MFHLNFLLFLHKLFDFRCFWFAAIAAPLISGLTSLISTGVSAGLQAKQMKDQKDMQNKELEQATKQLDFEKQKYNDNQKAQKEAGNTSISALNDSKGGIDGQIASIGSGSGLGLDTGLDTSFTRS